MKEPSQYRTHSLLCLALFGMERVMSKKVEFWLFGGANITGANTSL